MLKTELAAELARSESGDHIGCESNSCATDGVHNLMAVGSLLKFVISTIGVHCISY
jgi:hypothetical protein